ncbi:hypothetical protein ACTXKQ_12995 [Corynebacterium variabile]|uniref:hypothetical protein n=1 Tax=Corynebacterium variabile TaxID=1727 RepID=UPI002AA29BF1|nr:hypothetical protein [Corynebacterium variabile]
MTSTGPASASAGIITALVGFTGSFVVILTGLHAAAPPTARPPAGCRACAWSSVRPPCGSRCATASR